MLSLSEYLPQQRIDEMEREAKILNPIDWDAMSEIGEATDMYRHFLVENRRFAMQPDSLQSAIDDEVAAMDEPFDLESSYALFGTYMGIMPPLAIVMQFLNGLSDVSERLFFLILTIAAIVTTAVTGRKAAKWVANTLRPTFSMIVPNQLVCAAVMGAAWGAISGAAGGFLYFFFGAIVGGAIGAMAGAVATPAFSFAFRMLASGEHVERAKIAPFAIGIPFLMAAMILSAG